MKTSIHFEVLNLSKNGTKLCQVEYNKFRNANCSHGHGESIWITIYELELATLDASEDEVPFFLQNRPAKMRPLLLTRLW